MGGRGLQQFARDYPPQWRKRGLIMDDRWNHGGFVAPMILAHLDRKILAVGGTRHGGRGHRPVARIPRPHGDADQRQGGSDCETFALGFKEFKLGAGDRDAHLGRVGRHPRRQAAARRRHDHRARVRRLGPEGQGVASSKATASTPTSSSTSAPTASWEARTSSSISRSTCCSRRSRRTPGTWRRPRRSRRGPCSRCPRWTSPRTASARWGSATTASSTGRATRPSASRTRPGWSATRGTRTASTSPSPCPGTPRCACFPTTT